MKPTIQTLSSALAAFVLVSCAQVNTAVQSIPTTDKPLANSEIVAGLKAALEKGIQVAAASASQENGYLNNSLIVIPFPPDAQKVETKLRQIGLGKEVDKFVVSLNRAAEKASAKSVDVFVSAIRQMTIQDATGILYGEDDAATQYLKRTTSAQLTEEFEPIVEDALNEVNATKYYTELVFAYNKIPLVKNVDPDLEAYATKEAIDGLFILVAQEEAKIREDPAERTSEILERVFGHEE